MAKTEIQKLKEEIQIVRERLDALRDLEKRDFKELSALIKDVYTSAYQHVADLYDIIWPIEAKVLPKARAERQRLKALLGPKKLGQGEAWDKRKG